MCYCSYLLGTTRYTCKGGQICNTNREGKNSCSHTARYDAKVSGNSMDFTIKCFVSNLLYEGIEVKDFVLVDLAETFGTNVKALFTIPNTLVV